MKNYKSGGADLIAQTAELLRSYACDLDRLAESYESSLDPDYLSDALNCIQGCFGNIKLSLFPRRQERDRKNNHENV